ncbi:hypothetical protein K438DRAFT_1784840 [Mycena galopus ATCC 62051]|nr:hypothetical protein K438DRAFT_1784840 [Mycena galopus ATCC 62051]
MFSFATCLALLPLSLATPTLRPTPSISPTGAVLAPPKRSIHWRLYSQWTVNRRNCLPSDCARGTELGRVGACGFNGEGCTLVEATLSNGFSSTDISLIPPGSTTVPDVNCPSHTFSVASGFDRYYDGCDGAGADCTSSGCPQVMTDPSQTYKQVGCAAANVNLMV